MRTLTAGAEQNMSMSTNKHSTRSEQTLVAEQQHKQLGDASNNSTDRTEDNWSHAATVGSGYADPNKSGSESGASRNQGQVATNADNYLAKIQVWVDQLPLEEPWSPFCLRFPGINLDSGTHGARKG